MGNSLENKLSHFDLLGDKLNLLREVGAIVIPALDDVLESFYNRAGSDPEAAAFFDTPERMTFARGAQKKHWERLLTGAFDEDYLASVDRIGRTHARINLPLDVYMSAYSLATSDLIAALIQRIPLRKKRKLAAMIGVMTRAFALDIERVVQTFFDILSEEQNIAFDSLNTAIDRLAHGDLTYNIPGPDESAYPVRFDSVRVKLNDATCSLQDIMGTVTECMHALSGNIQDVSSSTDDFAQRTAGQAASLEQTSAAVHELAEHVTQSSGNTTSASSVVSKATQTAVEGAKTMVDASDAMTRIHAASEEITNIIGMIDDIAFQTNLLALNAGVEAARAGEAGRGFAVVAQEVRGLAANASEAALQIKELVNKSSAEVATGVTLIDGAGRELEAAVTSFKEISRLTTEIASASSEQSISLREINSAVAQMDGATQQNAALVEATATATARMRHLAGRAETALDKLHISAKSPTEFVTQPQEHAA